ncbi:trimethylamine methyltransferase family protein [Chelativorans xinjiangense]|uniref:trimethylamine methyltransferase family protein n=1 Tax=Chelativorans xinjiangense TaxID=2681485 RepID=UPI00135BCF98|nr:trimethylamine methyltransferase family protein [Chelativorans xinjiangense]
MASDSEGGQQQERRRRRRSSDSIPAVRTTGYKALRNPFKPQPIFSADQIEAIHHSAVRILKDLGIRILLPEAREIFRSIGCCVDEESLLVRIGPEAVADALSCSPKSISAKAGSRQRDSVFEHGTLAFVAGCGAPNVTDLDRGRRTGMLADFEDLVRLAQHFDVLHLHGPYVEPQDLELPVRHYGTMRAQLTLSDKLPFIFSRGTPQVEDCFEMVRLARGLSREEFRDGVHCYTIVNTNSPRQLDVPMAQGIIDFARAGQASIITPFCLAGAMAPITVAGALALQHAEALAGIVLAQASRKGAPVIYGSFSSNVDMKSGAPAFGTPEHVKATLGAGQLARYIGLPWRAGGGSASNDADAQAANETQFALWGAVLAGATVLVHAAGWLEGGLSVSYEKLVTDVEVLQGMAELFSAPPGDEEAIGYDAVADVQPGGHFFSTPHTMGRFRTAFYEPIVADWSNFGNWTESGSLNATQRANLVWKKVLVDFEPPASAAAAGEVLDAFIAPRIAEGGAPPIS